MAAAFKTELPPSKRPKQETLEQWQEIEEPSDWNYTASQVFTHGGQGGNGGLKKKGKWNRKKSGKGGGGRRGPNTDQPRDLSGPGEDPFADTDQERSWAADQEQTQQSKSDSDVRVMPIGPFNEGVPTSFRRAIPSSFHRGLLCQQPPGGSIRPVDEDFALDIAVVMGQEVAEKLSEIDRKKQKKSDYSLLDKQMRSRTNLPPLQFVNRDKKEIEALANRNVRLPSNGGSLNDMSDEEEADVRDFELPLVDLQEEDVPPHTRLTNTIRGKTVFNKKKTLVSEASQLAPASFLHCHICDKRGFSSLAHYNDHLAGEMHVNLRRMHVEALQAGLAYMRAGAKKAEYRLAMGLLRSSANPSKNFKGFCDACGCSVLEMKLHQQLPQHRLVEKFIFPRCCGLRFSNRVEFEDHRTKPSHLRDLFKQRLALTARLQEGKLKDEERFQSLPEYLRLLKANCLVNDDDSTSNLTPYDPNRPNVVKMLKYHGVIQCLCCGESFNRQQLEQLYEHVHSLAHYEAAVLYATQREREVLLEVARDKELYPDVVRKRARKVVKVAKALIEHGREKAASGECQRRMSPPSVPAEEDLPRVLLLAGEPVLEGEGGLADALRGEEDEEGSAVDAGEKSMDSTDPWNNDQTQIQTEPETKTEHDPGSADQGAGCTAGQTSTDGPATRAEESSVQPEERVH